MGQLLVEEFQQLGINSSLESLTSAVYSSPGSRGTGTSARSGSEGAILDPVAGLHPVHRLGLQAHRPRTPSPAIPYALRACLHATINKLADLDPTAASTIPAFNEALTQFYTYQPAIPYIQTVYWHVTSSQYWTGWPTNQNLTKYRATGGDSTSSSLAG